MCSALFCATLSNGLPKKGISASGFSKEVGCILNALPIIPGSASLGSLVKKSLPVTVSYKFPPDITFVNESIGLYVATSS